MVRAATLNRHRAQLRMNSHRNTERQSAWAAHAAVAFVFEVLDVLDPPEEPAQYSPRTSCRGGGPPAAAVALKLNLGVSEP